MAASRKIDYASIEPDWRAGIKSVPQLAADYERRTGVSVTHAAINKHFKKRGVPRDLSARIRAKAESKVSESMVSDKMVSGGVCIDTIIDANAEYVANIDISHRKDVRRFADIEEKLVGELESQTANSDVFDRLAEIMASPDDKGTDKLNDLYKKVISFPGRVDSLKKLAETMRMRVELERRVLKIDGQAHGQESIEDIIRRLDAN